MNKLNKHLLRITAGSGVIAGSLYLIDFLGPQSVAILVFACVVGALAYGVGWLVSGLWEK